MSLVSFKGTSLTLIENEVGKSRLKMKDALILFAILVAVRSSRGELLISEFSHGIEVIMKTVSLRKEILRGLGG